MHPATTAHTASLWSRFWSHGSARVFFPVLLLLYLSALLAPFLAPYGEADQLLSKAYHPPALPVWKNGQLQVPRLVLTNKATREFRLDTQNPWAPVSLFAKGSPYQWLGFIPCDRHLFTTSPTERLYLLGADSYGRCVFSRLLYGSQVSLSIGLIGIAITTVLGMLLGGIAGYFGGWTDSLLMRVTEVLMSIPGLYLILALRAVFSKDLDSANIYLVMIVILSFIGWSGTARVIRGMALSLRERDFISASRALGQNPLIIITRHIWPNVFSYVIVSATLSVPGYILGEASLSFLGLGIQDPQSSWGLMLAQAQSIRVLVSFWWMLLPGLLISLSVMSFNFVGDALRDAVDPKLRLAR